MARLTTKDLLASNEALRAQLDIANARINTLYLENEALKARADEPTHVEPMDVGPSHAPKRFVYALNGSPAWNAISYMRLKLVAKYGACKSTKVNGRTVLLANHGQVRVTAFMYSDRVEFVQ